MINAATLKKLRELASKATPGNWRHVCTITRADVVVDTIPSVSLPIASFNSTDGADDATDQEQRDAAFVAAASPQTVLALLDRIDELERENKNLRGAVIDACGAVFSTWDDRRKYGAIRHVANLLSAPFSWEAVEKRVEMMNATDATIATLCEEACKVADGLVDLAAPGLDTFRDCAVTDIADIRERLHDVISKELDQ